MLDYPALAALAQILRRGSFEAAAAALNITPSAVSQRIRSLEDRLGCRLIDRGPPLGPTPTGQRLAAHFDQVQLLESRLQHPLNPDSLPVIRISVNADSLATWAMPPLAQTPGLLDLLIDDQDHAHEHLASGHVSAAITSQARPLAGADATALGRMRYRATASPEFAARHFPDGATPQALRRAPSLSFNARDGLQDAWVRALTGQPIPLPLHRLPATHAFAEAARLGLGWGMNPQMLIEDDLSTGRLVDLCPGQPLDLPLFWHVSRQMAPALAPLTEAMTKAARAALLP